MAKHVVALRVHRLDRPAVAPPPPPPQSSSTDTPLGRPTVTDVDDDSLPLAKDLSSLLYYHLSQQHSARFDLLTLKSPGTHKHKYTQNVHEKERERENVSLEFLHVFRMLTRAKIRKRKSHPNCLLKSKLKLKCPNCTKQLLLS